MGIRSELSKTLSNQDSELEVRRRLSGQVEKTITSVVTVMGLAYLWLADSLDEDGKTSRVQARQRNVNSTAMWTPTAAAATATAAVVAACQLG